MEDARHAPRAERMSSVDTAWLRMDNDVNLMMIVGVWLLTPAITLGALRERVHPPLHWRPHCADVGGYVHHRWWH